MPAIIEFRDNGTAHDDIFLSLGGLEKTGDAYYLALDHSLGRDDESPDKIRLVLQRLLEQWRDAIRSVDEGSSVYLPYDFSDQYTGCLRCTRNGRDIVVADGWCDIEGWRVSPSSLGEYTKTNSNFQRGDGTEFTISASSLMEQINVAIDVAKKIDAEQVVDGS